MRKRVTETVASVLLALTVALSSLTVHASQHDSRCSRPSGDASGRVLAESSFDGGAEGWEVVNNGSKRGQAAGGHVTGKEGKSHATWYWSAPGRLLGDKSTGYGGTLEFDQFQTRTDDQTSGAHHVILKGAGLELSIGASRNPGAEWTHYSVVLHECAEWKHKATGDAATEEHLKRVLAALEGLFIRGEFRYGKDESSLDNVVMRTGSVTLSAEAGDIIEARAGDKMATATVGGETEPELAFVRASSSGFQQIGENGIGYGDTFAIEIRFGTVQEDARLSVDVEWEEGQQEVEMLRVGQTRTLFRSELLRVDYGGGAARLVPGAVQP